MDLQLPMRSVIPTIEADMLYLFSRIAAELSGAQVHRLIPGNRSVRGVQKALNRLADQGLIWKTERTNLSLYKRNPGHLAWPAVDALAALSTSMEQKISELIAKWQIQPISVSMFGSGARRDGGAQSDIDLLIIEPGEVPDDGIWEDEVETLTESLTAATGNVVQILSLSVPQLATYVNNKEPIIAEWQRDAKLLAGQDIRALISAAAA